MPRHNDAIEKMPRIPNVHSKRSLRQRRARSNLRQLRHLRQKRQLNHTPQRTFPSGHRKEEEKWYKEILDPIESVEKRSKKELHKNHNKKTSSTQKRRAQKNVLPRLTRM